MKIEDIDKNLKGMDLSLDTLTDNKERIKKLFDIALEEEFTVYFDGRYVEEPYDGLEFKTIEEEFYYAEISGCITQYIFMFSDCECGAWPGDYGI